MSGNLTNQHRSGNGKTIGPFTLTVVFDSIQEEDQEPYIVARCLELPGCVADGNTQNEAQNALQSSIAACLDVVLEDSLRRLMADAVPRRSHETTSEYQIEVDVTPRLRVA